MRRITWVSSLIVAILAAAAVAYGGPLVEFLSDRKAAPAAHAPAIEKSDNDPFNLPDGRHTYRVIQAADVWPKILEAVIDPPDVHVGDVQRLEIIVQSPERIVSVTATTKLDHETVTIPLKLVGEVSRADLSPNPYALDASGRLVMIDDRFPRLSQQPALPAARAADYPRLKYVAEWTVRDTHDERYYTTFTVEDAGGGKRSSTIAWTDACLIPKSGDWSLSMNAADCRIASPDGVEAGDVTVNTFILTLDHDFAFNPGYSVRVTTGEIWLGTGALRQAYVLRRDFDADTYPQSGAIVSSTETNTLGWQRRKDLAEPVDCDDTAPSVYQNINNLLSDADGDDYLAGVPQTICVGEINPVTIGGNSYTDKNGAEWVEAGSALGDNDCDDTNSSYWQNRSLEADLDADRLTEGAASTQCVGAQLCSRWYSRGFSSSLSCTSGTMAGQRLYLDPLQRLGTEAAPACTQSLPC